MLFSESKTKHTKVKSYITNVPNKKSLIQRLTSDTFSTRIRKNKNDESR